MVPLMSFRDRAFISRNSTPSLSSLVRSDMSSSGMVRLSAGSLQSWEPGFYITGYQLLDWRDAAFGWSPLYYGPTYKHKQSEHPNIQQRSRIGTVQSTNGM